MEYDADGTPSPWPELPADVLSKIAGLLDPTIGIIRLRSVCRPWRFLLSLSSFSPHFPLNLPSVSSLSSNFLSPPPPSTNLSLVRRTVCLLSPPDDFSLGFLVKVGEDSPNTFSLLDPLSDQKQRIPSSPISLLDYRVVVLCYLYVVKDASSGVSSSSSWSEPHLGAELGLGPTQNLIKKVVVQRNFFGEGDFVVLCLTDIGKLLFWKLGDEGWTEIGHTDRRFDDVISFKGKFYATADRKGRLVMIDSRLKPMDLVRSLIYGCGECTHLLESEGRLYVVDRIQDYNRLEFGVYKLDDKSRFWEYELSLQGNVFFVGNDANFSVSKKDYYGNVRNAIYFITNIHDVNEGKDFTAVLDIDKSKGTIHPLFAPSRNRFGCLYWPPPSWFC